MEFIRHFRKFCLVTFMFAAHGVSAAPLEMKSEDYRPAASEQVRYNLYANGLKVGHFTLWWEEQGDTYKATFSLKTSGIVRFFKKQDRYSQTVGKISYSKDQVILTPTHFHAFSQGKNKSRTIDIDYDAKGNTAKTNVDPPDNPSTRPPVSEDGKNKAIDPMTSFQTMFALAAAKEDHGTITVFDGRRLTKITFSPTPNNPFRCKTCTVYALAREPIEGFDADDIEDFKKGDPPMRVAIEPMVSRFPYGARVDLGWGVLTAERDK